MNLLVHFPATDDINIVKRIGLIKSVKYLFYIGSNTVKLEPNDFRIPIESIPYDQAGNGLYSLTDLPPLEGPLLDCMLPTEAIVIKQMDRLEFYNPIYTSYAARRALYLKHLQFWNHILVSRQIDLFIGSNIPHEVYDYVIFGLCKAHGIDTHFLFQSAIPSTVHPLSDYTNFTPKLAAVYDRYKKLHLNSSAVDIKLPPKMQNEWNRQAKNTIPFYMEQTVRYHCNNKIINSEYESLAQNIDFKNPYIYFPLHYQPENTTSPLGGAFCDQITALKLISKNLPPPFKIVVKEHPMQNWIGRGQGFYKNILDQCENIIFAKKTTSSHMLINEAVCVATITGTAGWEALFRKKPVLLFGYIFYSLAPGVYNVKTNDECRKAIIDIIEKKFIYDEKMLKIFLLSLESTSIAGVVDSSYRKESLIDPRVSEYNIVQHFERTIDEIRSKRYLFLLE